VSETENTNSEQIEEKMNVSEAPSHSSGKDIPAKLLQRAPWTKWNLRGGPKINYNESLEYIKPKKKK
jgi:hypothetical protein